MAFRTKKINIEFLVVCVLLSIVFGVLVLMYLRISRTSDESAIEILREKNQFVEKELDLFFHPIQERIEEECLFVYLNAGVMIDSSLLAYRAFSAQRSNSVISSIVVADTFGTQEFHGRLRDRNKWYYLRSHLGNKTPRLPDVKIWRFEGQDIKLDTQYLGAKSNYDPRTRPWFRSAINSSEMVWTEPYTFATSFVPGITLSKFVRSRSPRILVFDVTLESLSLKTSNIDVSARGFAFVISDSAKIVGLPQKEYAGSLDSVKKFALKDLHALNNQLLSTSYDQWRSLNNPSFKMVVNNESYWVHFSPYVLGNIRFYVGIVAPENEIIGSIIKTKNLLRYGLLLILVFSIFAGYSYRQKSRSNKLLNEKNLLIEEQKRIVDHKNREIIDSITYAKHLQEAILPPDNYWKEQLPNSFVLYKPKDIVAGDFYWMERVGDKVFFAAADCTGHGVPGAMVSVVCSNALNRTLLEFEISEPGKMLDKTRELVIATFEKGKKEVKDGMDISLCCLNLSTNRLHWTGANNPLWKLSEGEFQEIKADKQPIGKYADTKPFTTHSISLAKNDLIYIFTDGFADQFGGPLGKKFKYKTLQQLLLANASAPMSEQLKKLDRAFEDWKGHLEQVDDVCIIGVRV